MPRPAPKPPSTSRILPTAASAMRAAIALAGGREVCFVCAVDREGMIQTARVVSRGNVESVLALPGFASRGEMLSAGSPQTGSAGYVAVERVTGALHGRTGTFALQHWGIMDKGAPELKISVIPDSGTRDLAGLSGTMTIDIQPGGKHFYVFTYTLPPAAR